MGADLRRDHRDAGPRAAHERPVVPDHATVDHHGRARPGERARALPQLESAPLEWDAIGGDYLRDVLRTLAGRGYRGIDSAEVLRLDTPADWARQGMSAGTPFAAAHTLTQTGPLRRPQRVPGLENAVLAGSMTHPGVGVPPALISGRLAAQALGSS